MYLRSILILLILTSALAFSVAAKNAVEADPIAILRGSWPDPTILKVGDKYLMTQSVAGGYYPNNLIWESEDLLEWTPLTYARPESGGGLAPDLAYVNGTYYLYCERTTPLTASSPSGPWTEHPHMDGSEGIDPGHLKAKDGKRYLYSSKGYMALLEGDGLSYTTPPQKVYDGWEIPEDWAYTLLHLESPKLFFKDGYYYMVSAQGGTFGVATGHMAVVARSRNPEGPWENAPYNPLIRTDNRDEPWWGEGHATIFEGPNGDWFALYHGYKNGYRLLGRCTLLLPIEWTEEGWPVVAEKWPRGFSEDAMKINLPMSDEFDGNSLGLQWQSPEKHDLSRYEFVDGKLIVKGYGKTVGDCRPLTVNNGEISYVLETQLKLNGADFAGLVIYYNAEVYVSFGITKEGIVKKETLAGTRRILPTRQYKHHGDTVRLKIINDKSDVRFYFQQTDGSWKFVESSEDIGGMDDNGFLQNSSMRPGIFVTGEGSAAFSYFRHTVNVQK
ncbi:MAG: family 43 glycosylhydrolase [Opitutales bacterium]|nr:family 43 glycosylhydrolase [Opitutales bacterium]